MHLDLLGAQVLAASCPTINLVTSKYALSKDYGLLQTNEQPTK